MSRGCSLWIAVDCAPKYFANEPRNALQSTEGSSLPRSGAPSVRHSVEDPTHMTKPIRVLLLSDKESDAELISSALSRSGMSTVTSRVDSQETFTAVLSELSPDVVLSEFSSTRFDARGAMDVMRRISPATPLIVVTEWKEFRSPDLAEIKRLLRQPLLFDGRNLFDPSVVRSAGLEYFGIGRR